MTELVSVAIFLAGLYYVSFAIVRWIRKPHEHWTPEPQKPIPIPVEPTPCEGCIELERRLKRAEAKANRWESTAEATIEAYRAGMPELHSILRRVRDHHLPGWKLTEAGMCPICVESKLFERVEALFHSDLSWVWKDEETPQP